MEHINKVEIAGVIGNVKITKLSTDIHLIRLTVATNHVFRSHGEMVVETTWHNVSYFSSQTDNFDMDKFTKGQGVHVEGRLKTNRFTGADGIERSSYEIVAYKLKLINA